MTRSTFRVFNRPFLLSIPQDPVSAPASGGADEDDVTGLTGLAGAVGAEDATPLDGNGAEVAGAGEEQRHQRFHETEKLEYQKMREIIAKSRAEEAEARRSADVDQAARAASMQTSTSWRMPSLVAGADAPDFICCGPLSEEALSRAQEASRTLAVVYLREADIPPSPAPLPADAAAAVSMAASAVPMQIALFAEGANLKV